MFSLHKIMLGSVMCMSQIQVVGILGSIFNQSQHHRPEMAAGNPSWCVVRGTWLAAWTMQS